MSLRHGHPPPRQLQRVLPLRGYGALQQARVHSTLTRPRAHGVRSGSHHPLRPAPHRRPLPVLHLPDPVRSEVHPLRKRPPPRPEARQLACQRRLRAQDLRFRSGTRFLDGPRGERWVHDRVRCDSMVQSSRDHVEFPELHKSQYVHHNSTFTGIKARGGSGSRAALNGHPTIISGQPS
jgi:hypothetical protein